MTKLSLLCFGLCALLALPAWAQQGALDAAPDAAEMATTTTTTVTSDETPSRNDDQEDASDSNKDWALCPAPDVALSKVPSELDALQADIDRYTLCLNRAELLMKLEDLKTQNANAGSVGSGMTLPGAMTPAPLTAQQTSDLLGTDKKSGAAPTIMAPASTEYTIRDVRGIGDMLMARLESPDGEPIQVKTGDTLDDGSVITAITTTQVMARNKGGITKPLSWKN